MNKIVFNSADIEWLLAWRDNHKEEVRKAPASLKSIQMEFPEVKRKVKCIREGNRLRLSLNEKGLSTGHCELELVANGWKLIKAKFLDQEQIQTMLTVYSSLMALMAFGSPTGNENASPKGKKESQNNPKRSRSAKGITYILRRSNTREAVLPAGKHSSPQGVFSVRGHYRHYKNGKVVWIDEYKKGEGNQKKRTYKIGPKT